MGDDAALVERQRLIAQGLEAFEALNVGGPAWVNCSMRIVPWLRDENARLAAEAARLRTALADALLLANQQQVFMEMRMEGGGGESLKPVLADFRSDLDAMRATLIAAALAESPQPEDARRVVAILGGAFGEASLARMAEYLSSEPWEWDETRPGGELLQLVAAEDSRIFATNAPVERIEDEVDTKPESVCPRCDGERTDPMSDAVPCSMCGGTGERPAPVPGDEGETDG